MTDSPIGEIVCGGIFLLVLILPLFLLSRLLKVEHDDFHEQWLRDGRPHAMPFWFSFKEINSFGLGSYPWFVGTWWLFKTPNWIKGHKPASQLLKYYRLVSYVIYLGLLTLCLLILFSSLR